MCWALSGFSFGGWWYWFWGFSSVNLCVHLQSWINKKHVHLSPIKLLCKFICKCKRNPRAPWRGASSAPGTAEVTYHQCDTHETCHTGVQPGESRDGPILERTKLGRAAGFETPKHVASTPSEKASTSLKCKGERK